MNRRITLAALVMLALVSGAEIVCNLNSSTDWVLTKGEAMPSSVTCTNISFNPSINPTLPNGLRYSRGAISGTPTNAQAKVVYSITSGNNSGAFSISILGVPSMISAPMVEQDVYKNLAFLPITFKGDAPLDVFAITPALPQGLTLDAATGVLSGTYTGTAASSVYYTVSGSNSMGGPVTTSITLRYLEDTRQERYFSACYYTVNAGTRTLSAESWFVDNAAALCAGLTKLDCEDNYTEEEDHTWPDLDERIETAFAAMITGYIHIGMTASYDFTLTASDGAALYFNNEANPAIKFDGASSTVRSQSIGRSLTSGKHLIRLYFINGEGKARLKLEYKSDAASLPLTTIDNVVAYLGGYAPGNVSYKPLTLFVGGPVEQYRPPYNGCPVSGWTANPNPPAGLTMSFNGVVIGTPTAAQAETTVTVTATGALGVAKCPLTISVGAEPLDSLFTRFYTFSSQMQNICSMGSFPTQWLTLQVRQNEENIYHEEAGQGVAWEGVPGDLFYRFYAVWTGYIRVDGSGEHVFRLVNKDGARLIINSDTVINNWGCLNEMTEAEGTYSFSGGGYAAIEVQYFVNSGNFGILLSWKQPKSDTFEPISNDRLKHIPDSQFTYSTRSTKFYRDIPIKAMQPVFYGIVPQSPSFTIGPELPDGLVMDPSTGHITGTATKDTESAQYTITCTFGEQTLTTQISFSVVYVAPPSGIRFQLGGVDISSVTLQQFSTLSYIAVSVSSGSARAWTFSPDLPSGISFSSTNMRISGRPTQQMGTTMFTVTAKNEGGSTSAQLAITVTGCQYNNFFFSSLNSRASGQFTMKKGDVEVIPQTAIAAGDASVAFCEPLDTYTYIFTCSQERNCVFSIKRDDGLTFSTVSVSRNGSVTQDLSTIITVAPKITSETPDITVALRQPFEIKLLTEGIHHPVTFLPELPSEVKFDSSTFVLSGTFTTMQTFVTIARVYNEKGDGTLMLTINVGTCPDAKNLITFTRAQSRAEEYMKITFGADVVLETTFDGQSYSRTMCLANGEYNVFMTTTSTSGGWLVGHELMVKDTWDDLLTSIILDAPKKEDTVSFSIAYVIPDVMPIKFLNTNAAPPSGWTGVNFNDGAWKEDIVDKFGDFAGKTVYFRKAFTVDNRYKYVLFEFELQIVDGAVAYINGKEAARRNMPEGTVTHTTEAISRYSELLWYRTGVPTSMLSNGKNVLAVELHRHSLTPNHVQFDMYGTLLHGKCMYRGDRGTATGSDHSTHPDYRPRNAFDQDVTSVWRDSTLPVWVQWTYNDYRWEYINAIYISSSNQWNRNQVKHFTLWGYIDDDTKDELLTVDNRQIFSASYQRVEFMLERAGTYPAYRLEVFEANNSGSSTIVVAELLLYSCNAVYCPKNGGWKSILTETSAYGTCPRNSVGESMRYCGREGEFEPKWGPVDYTYCKSTKPKAGEAYIDMKYMVTNSTMAYYMSRVRAGLATEVREFLSAKSEKVELYLDRECNDSELENVCVYIRVAVDSRVADYAFEQVPLMRTGLTMKMIANYNLEPSIYFIAATEPQLSKYQMVSPVLVVVVVVLILALIAAVYVYLKKTDKLKDKVRGDKTKKVNKKEKDGLLV